MGENAGAIQALPFAYFEGPNEQDPSDELIQFEEYRLGALAEAHRKACVLNLGVGHTDDALWDRSASQNLARNVIATSSIIGLHGYGEGIISASCGDYFWKPDGSWNGPTGPFPPGPLSSDMGLWQAMRPYNDLHKLRSLGYDVWIVITEGGCDDNYNGGSNGVFLPYGIRTRGWRSCKQVWQRAGWLSQMTGEQFMLKSLDWYCRLTGFLIAVYAEGDRNEDGTQGTFDTVGLL